MRSLSTGVVAWRKLLWLPLAVVTLLMSWAVQATEPVQIGFTLEGCRLETGATYDQSNFTCTDEGYVTGNLGKQWNELDYVPHRVTLKNGNGPQTFDFIVAGDYTPNSNSTTGWDDITALTLNTSLSDGSCNAVVSGPVSITPGGSGAGGAYETIYREIEATMAPGETCVYDYAQRLSLGASEFSGSSLQSNLWNEFLTSSGIGQKRIQLPVADILPQELNKDMNAQQDTVYMWNLTKTAVPSNLSFQNSCERDDPMTETTTIRIEWQRLPGDPGKVTVVTNIYAYNPAHLDVHVSVTDMIYGDLGGGEVLLGTASADDVLVPAGATVKLLTHSIPDVDEGVFGLNDLAHATYKIGTIEVPGQTDAFASAEVQPSGNEVDATAVISDVEGPITGAGYMFSVDSVNGSGDFTDGYSLGEMTAGPVAWSSTEQSGDGFVEFVKTIYLDEPRDSSGELPDIATLLASDNFEISKNASVTFADYPLVELTIHKTIDLDLDEGENASFYFDVYRVDDIDEMVAENVEISFGSGETDKSVVIGNLDPNETYRVVEVSGSDGFTLDDEQQASILLPICGGDVYFANEVEPASAKAIKVTVPAGHDPSGFEFLLSGPGLNGGVQAVSDGAGNAVFPVELFEEGEYTITEQPREGWELTDVSGGETNSVESANCTFIVNLPESANYEFQCTFENTKLATIIVTKVIEGNNALNLSGDFDFDSSVATFDAMLDAQTWSFGAAALSGDFVSREFTNLSPGSYDVTEADPFLDLFSLTDITCIDPSGDSQTGGFTANIELAAGETVECIFTNTKLAAPGNLIIYKTTIGNVGTFNYDSSDGTLPPFSLTTLSENTPTTSPLATFNNLEPGIYKANELVPAGWDLTDLYCVDAVSIDGSQTEVNMATAEVSVSIDDGETVECFYENTKRGYIIVDKVTDPAGDLQLFDFDPSYAGPFALADATTPHMSEPLVNGTYSVSETVPAGWDLTSATCDDGSLPSAIDLQPGETVTCTFENTKRGYIIVDKVTDPAGDLQLFDFDPSYAGPFALADATTPHMSEPLVNGTYSVSETVPAGWDLTSATCDDGSLPSAIDLQPGETVTCTFENTKRGYIIVDKVTDPAGDLQLFDFDPSYAGPFALADATTPHMSEPLVNGTYSVSETVPAGWDLTSATCDDGSLPSAIDLQPGETVTCTFENTKRGYIIVDKVTDPAGDLQLFDFDPSYAGPFALADATTPHMSEPLVNGTYSVSETVPAGWDLTSATCDDGSAPNAIDLQPGETVTCTFENTKRGMAEVLKTVSGIAPNGVYPAFDFQIRDGSGAVASATSDVITGFAYFSCEAGVSPDVCVDVDGMAKLVPGAYEFCELDVQPGWMLTGSSNDGPLSWYSLIIGEDYIGECAAFTLSVAETESFNVDNTPPPGGNARTIGFWKNWTSCDGKGNQYDRWLTDPDFYDVLDEFLPIYLHPELEITQCAVGVDLLDKRDVEDPSLVGDGSKKASDAAYGLAAQLMAVQLNIAADAGTCSELINAKVAAEQLLADIDFTGTGDYLKKPKGPSKTLAQEAKTLAGILDSYNNNMLCP